MIHFRRPVRLLLCVASLCVATSGLRAFSTGAPQANCSQCHSGGDFDPSAELEAPGSIRPGQRVDLRLLLRDGAAPRAGFFLVAGQGSFPVPSNDSGAQRVDTSTLTHTAARSFGRGVASWDFSWTAPEREGRATFTLDYLVANGAATATHRSETFRLEVAHPPLRTEIIASLDEAEVPVDITFTQATSGGVEPYRFEWDFGNGETSTRTRPTVRYGSAGRFTVRLRVVDDRGVAAEATTRFVGTEPAPGPDIRFRLAPASGAAPLRVAFEAEGEFGVAPQVFRWDLGDGRRASERSFSRLFSAPGEFRVTLEVEDALGRTDRHVETLRVTAPPREASFRRGDVNQDGNRNIADAVTLLAHLFRNGEAPDCRKAADVDDSGGLNLTDAVWILNYLFLQGRPPRAPFPGCGRDPTEDELDCEASASC